MGTLCPHARQPPETPPPQHPQHPTTPATSLEIRVKILSMKFAVVSLQQTRDRYLTSGNNFHEVKMAEWSRGWFETKPPWFRACSNSFTFLFRDRHPTGDILIQSWSAPSYGRPIPNLHPEAPRMSAGCPRENLFLAVTTLYYTLSLTTSFGFV